MINVRRHSCAASRYLGVCQCAEGFQIWREPLARPASPISAAELPGDPRKQNGPVQRPSETAHPDLDAILIAAILAPAQIRSGPTARRFLPGTGSNHRCRRKFAGECVRRGSQGGRQDRAACGTRRPLSGRLRCSIRAQGGQDALLSLTPNSAGTAAGSDRIICLARVGPGSRGYAAWAISEEDDQRGGRERRDPAPCYNCL